jgi:hypothetical protein
MATNVRQSLSTTKGPASILVNQIVPVMEMWLAARRAMVEAFLTEPGLYCDPIGYVLAGGDAFVEAPTLFLARNVSMPAEGFAKLGLPEAGYHILETSDADEPLVMAFGRPQNGDPTIELEAAFQTSRYNLLCDYPFGEFRRELGQYEQGLALSAIGTPRIRPVEILS